MIRPSVMFTVCLPSVVPVGAGGDPLVEAWLDSVEVATTSTVVEVKFSSTMVPPSLRMARHRPLSSLYFRTELMSAMTIPGPRMAPMYWMQMLW